MRMSDSIEQFIKEMLMGEEEEVELKRNELAEYFGCAPSQINYVLSTRFTPARGYIIESRRGGGGCIRIFRMARATSDALAELLNEQVGESLDEFTAIQLIRRLLEEGRVTAREAAVMSGALSGTSFALPIPADLKDKLRARMFRGMLTGLARAPKEAKNG